jgi:hypothetical protein
MYLPFQAGLLRRHHRQGSLDRWRRVGLRHQGRLLREGPGRRLVRKSRAGNEERHDTLQNDIYYKDTWYNDSETIINMQHNCTQRDASERKYTKHYNVKQKVAMLNASHLPELNIFVFKSGDVSTHPKLEPHPVRGSGSTVCKLALRRCRRTR